MLLHIFGDTHGPLEINKINPKRFLGRALTDNDAIVICGDFGFPFMPTDCISEDALKESGAEHYCIKYARAYRQNIDWLKTFPCNILFVDGNHENHVRLATYPVKQWHGGLVHEIRPHVLHLMRGEMFDIEGRNFFAFGGASSHDVSDGILDYEDSDWREQARKLDKQYKFMYRVKGLSWWQEELPTEAEMQHGFDTLEKYGNKVDFIISHSPSTSELYLMGGRWLYEPDVLTNYLDEVKARASFDYKKHLFGHMHVNKAINTQDICIYEQIIQIL